MIRIELIRAWHGRHEATSVELAPGACVGDALSAAGWSLDAEFVGLAVFGEAATQSTLLNAGDRIELLRRLQVDPKQARRLRAGRAKASA